MGDAWSQYGCSKASATQCHASDDSESRMLSVSSPGW